MSSPSNSNALSRSLLDLLVPSVHAAGAPARAEATAELPAALPAGLAALCVQAGWLPDTPHFAVAASVRDRPPLPTVDAHR
jgi:hypothetical protein